MKFCNQGKVKSQADVWKKRTRLLVNEAIDYGKLYGQQMHLEFLLKG